jgi:FkbM family methyltransferase
MLADSPARSMAQTLHNARSFTSPPDSAQALSLLAEIAAASCAYKSAVPRAPLALYGAGKLGALARDFLRTVGLDFVMAIDRNARGLADDPAWTGVALRQPEDVDERAKREIRLAVSVVTTPYVPLERSLGELGFADIVPFFDLAESFRHVHPLGNGWFAPQLTKEDQNNTAKVLTLWGDDVSRAHHLQFLAWRRLREEWIFDSAPHPASDRFFIPEVNRLLRRDEILLDAGAHYGSVTKTFVTQSEGSFGQIIAVEPDAANRARLRTNLQSWLPGDPRVAVHDWVLAADDGETIFHEGLGYASQISDTGRMHVRSRHIDALGLSPTFIKLHLEGGELAALKGAHRTLLSQRPIVAATIYHNADGIWKTPLWLMKTLPDYLFLFRADSWCGNGAVVYCLPKERVAS